MSTYSGRLVCLVYPPKIPGKRRPQPRFRKEPTEFADMVLRPAVASWSWSDGRIAGLTNPDASVAVIADESTAVPPSSERWGFPQAGGQSLSYWLQQVRCDELLDHRTTPGLPEAAGTVVVGSGVSIS